MGLDACKEDFSEVATDQLVAGGVLILLSNITFTSIYACLEHTMMELNDNLLSIWPSQCAIVSNPFDSKFLCIIYS